MNNGDLKGKSAFPQRLKGLIDQKKQIQTSDGRNITLDYIGRQIGKSKSSLSYYLSGDTFPDLDTLVRIAEFFDVSTDYLLGLTEVRSPVVGLQQTCEYTGFSEKEVNSLLCTDPVVPAKYNAIELKHEREENRKTLVPIIRWLLRFKSKTACILQLYHLKCFSECKQKQVTVSYPVGLDENGCPQLSHYDISREEFLYREVAAAFQPVIQEAADKLIQSQGFDKEE
ncbi:MAG: helix-turn-helix domain-containing protein [Lachnospiraceae bacterium]|nr:helix-turn-helix domain-containing protein [Lachnospiraceae bacterium]